MFFESLYNFESRPEGVSLISNLPCTFSLDEEVFNSQGDIILDHDYNVHIRTKIQIDFHRYHQIISTTTWSGNQDIILNKHRFSAFITNISWSMESETATIIFVPNSQPFLFEGDSQTRLSKVYFHLFDFKAKTGTSTEMVRFGDSFVGIHKIELASMKWKVELHSVPDENNQNNFYPKLSHIGCLSRIDGLMFDGKSAQQMIVDLQYFFTFCQGVFCRPIMPVGFDEHENRVWALANSPDQRIKVSW